MSSFLRCIFTSWLHNGCGIDSNIVTHEKTRGVQGIFFNSLFYYYLQDSHLNWRKWCDDELSRNAPMLLKFLASKFRHSFSFFSHGIDKLYITFLGLGFMCLNFVFQY